MSLPDRDPTVDVTLTPDAERITARVDGWMREVRDRAERGQLKYPPWHTATTPRNAGREGVEEALDLLWYLSAAQDQIAHLTARIAELRQARRREKALTMIAQQAGGSFWFDDYDPDNKVSRAISHLHGVHSGRPIEALDAAWDALHAAGLVED